MLQKLGKLTGKADMEETIPATGTPLESELLPGVSLTFKIAIHNKKGPCTIMFEKEHTASLKIGSCLKKPINETEGW